MPKTTRQADEATAELAKRRWEGWPDNVACPRCGNASSTDFFCLKCCKPFSVTTGTELEGTKLTPTQIFAIASIFSKQRNGLSIRDLATDAKIARATGDKLLRLIRTKLRNEPTMPLIGHGSSLAAEVRVARRTLELNPPSSRKDGWRLLLLCRVHVLESRQNRTPVELESMRVDRLPDTTTQSLNHALAALTQTAADVFVFSGSRFHHAGRTVLNFAKFKQARVVRQIEARLKDLKDILITSHNGRFIGENAEPLLAEFHFRQKYRKNHTSFIAKRVLELLLREDEGCSEK